MNELRSDKPASTPSRRNLVPNLFLADLLLLLAFDNFVLPRTRQPAQVPGIWKTLSQVSWPSTPDGFSNPQFSNEVKKLNGSVITISGYLVPTDLHSSSSAVMISAYPVQSCFFCGGAGPESVIEVYPKQKDNYLLKKLTFRGTLVLNTHDAEHMVYQLKNAERIFLDE